MVDQRKIIIDTDPGHDDAVAIFTALGSRELRTLGITAVAGNVPLELTARNSMALCECAGRADIPVFAGCDRPLKRALVTAEEVHGRTGLDGVSFPMPEMQLQPQHAIDFLIDTLRNEPEGTVTLCPLGPLTNVATAMLRAPDIVDRIEQIVLMGGAYFEVGNVTPTAEFNIYVDPEAAKIVFGSGVQLTVLPLDVTHKALTTPKRLDAFRDLGTKQGQVVADLLATYNRHDTAKYGSEGGPLHDPCVIAYLLNPELFSGRLVNVEIETESELTMGMTVVDWWKVTNRSENAMFISEVDADGFFELITEKLACL